MGYSKQFLIDAFLWRYTDVLLAYSMERMEAYVQMVTNFYDQVGRDKFRVYGSLDAVEIAKFRLATGC